MTDTPDYAALCAQMAAALDASREELRLIRMKDCDRVYNPLLGIQIDAALTAYRTLSPDPVYSNARTLWNEVERVRAQIESRARLAREASLPETAASLDRFAAGLKTALNRARGEG